MQEPLLRCRIRLAAFLFLLLPVLVVHTLRAQVPVTLHLRQPPPHQLRFSDLWEVDITNPGAAVPNAQLVTVVRSGAAGVILTATTGSFTLPTGIKIITAANSKDLGPIQTQYGGGGFRDAIVRTSGFPAGDYTVCVTVRSVTPTRVGDLATDCIDQTVESDVSPILIMPANEAVLQEPFPIFTWTWGGAGRPDTRITYKLKIVEILGKQSPNAAMQRNLAWFEQNNLRSSVMQYPPPARPLQSGRRYAWMVTAFTIDQPAGESEVWEFTYQLPDLKPAVHVTVAPKATITIDVLQELLRSCSETP